MRELERTLGSVRNLVAFEAAARLKSFSLAANELGITQPAVSQAVRRLEGAIGVKLFQRSHRAIALTDAGVRLHGDVAEGFGRILSTARQLGRAGQGGHVTVLASTAFATWWMVPRLAGFRTEHPAVDLRIETLDRDLDISSESMSLAIRRGDGRWSGYDSALLAPEVLLPIASPAFVQKAGTPRRMREFLSLPLIHLDEPHRYRPAWTEWFKHFGVAFRDTGAGLRLNDYALVLQAAMAGEGIALGWTHVCAHPLAQGWLERVGTWEWRTDEGFYLVWSATRPISPHAVLVRDWMLRQASGVRLPATGGPASGQVHRHEQAR